MRSADPIREKVSVKAFAEYYLEQGNYRNYALIVMGIHTAMRISDMLSLRWCDVYDAEKQKVRQIITISEKKTGKSRTISLHKLVVSALTIYYSLTQQPDGDRYLFENNRKTKKAISRVQAHRIIKEAANAVGLEGTISCHSLRKTFGYHAWKNNISLAVIMEIYNHSSFRITKRYLGITQDNKNNAYMSLNVM